MSVLHLTEPHSYQVAAHNAAEYWCRNKTFKWWGWSEEIYAGETTRIVRAFALPLGYSSRHKHNHQDNVFIIEKGHLNVTIYEDDDCDGITWHAHLHDKAMGARTAYIPAGVWHCFEATTDCWFREVYIGNPGKPNPDDIVRADRGGLRR